MLELHVPTPSEISNFKGRPKLALKKIFRFICVIVFINSKHILVIAFQDK